MNRQDSVAWFEEGEWLSGWKALPHSTIDVKTFSSTYFAKPGLWQQAFRFLAETDFSVMSAGVYKLAGDDLFAMIQEYTTLDEDETLYEAHRRYADIQYMISGTEMMGVLPLSGTTEVIPYDAEKDVAFFSVEKDIFHVASPSHFFIFFPGDAHRPCVKNGVRTPVKKLVVKVGL